jgi:hypothetical protein
MSFPLNPVAGQQFTKDGVLYHFNPPRGWEIEGTAVPSLPLAPSAASLLSGDAKNQLKLGADAKFFVPLDGGSA